MSDFTEQGVFIPKCLRKKPDEPLNIYLIKADAIYPIGDAGAVVIARDTEEALRLTKVLSNPKPPVWIGHADPDIQSARIVMINTTDY